MLTTTGDIHDLRKQFGYFEMTFSRSALSWGASTKYVFLEGGVTFEREILC